MCVFDSIFSSGCLNTAGFVRIKTKDEAKIKKLRVRLVFYIILKIIFIEKKIHSKLKIATLKTFLIFFI
jgi:hypothetical protein